MNAVIPKPNNSSLLGTIQKQHRGSEVKLPPELAESVVISYFDRLNISCQFLSPEAYQGQGLPPLGEDMWCFALKHHPTLFEHYFPHHVLAKTLPVTLSGQVYEIFIFPKHTLLVQSDKAKSFLLRLERYKETMFRDERDLPLAWSAVQSPTISLEQSTSVESEETETCCVNESLPNQEDVVLEESETVCEFCIPREDIVAEFERIRKHVGLSSFPFELYHQAKHCNGYVSGKVKINRENSPVSMMLVVCPNADFAEIAATLVHEFAHIFSEVNNHNHSFKKRMVELASALYGDHYFVEPRKRLDESYRILDMWIATGIRAKLRGQEPPVAKDFDEQLTASVVSRIQKMRALAASQPGTPEAITATGIANTQITLYQLGSYQIRLDVNLDESMVDRWISVGKNVRWKRELGFDVADFCNVFALARPDQGWMHFFGKHRDIVATEYLYHVCLEHIERKCEQYIKEWKTTIWWKPSSGEVRSEKTSFCASAVRGISDKMKEIREIERLEAQLSPDSSEARGYRLTSEDLRKAEAFSAQEHVKRGMGWSHESSYSHTHNSSGYEAGQDVSLHAGVESRKVRGLLGS